MHSPDHETLAHEIYGRCQVFLQSSRREGFGFTAIEAMACGAALVTTDNGGSRDYAIDGETALVAPPHDVDAMASLVVSLLRDDVRRSEVAQAGERHVRKFDWDIGAAAIEDVLVRYIADPAAFQRPPSDREADPSQPSELTS